MKKFLKSKKALLPSLAASAILVTSFGMAEFTAQKIAKVGSLNEGSSTCFTRVGQTFTALMIGNFNSDYLSKNFVSSTGECFSQLNKGFEEQFAAGFMAAQKPLNKLTSDLFWFHEKSQNLAKKASEGETELSLNSNIVDKFAALETLNFEFQEKLAAKKSSLETRREILNILALLGAFGLAAAALLSGRKREAEKKEIARIEAEAFTLLEKKQDLDVMVLKSGRIFERLLNVIGAKSCHELYSGVQNDLIETRSHRAGTPYQEMASLAETEIKHEVKEKESSEELANINRAAKKTADRLREAFSSHGIKVEENLNEDFWVKANAESLEQLLFNLYSFSIEGASKAQGNKKIAFKSKALGGISYFKARISSCLLNPEEMEIFNGSNHSSGNVNLVLLKEVATDLGCSITAKNILNGGKGFTGCEVELVFTRAKEQRQNAKNPGMVLKGGKKEILRRLQSEA